MIRGLPPPAGPAAPPAGMPPCAALCCRHIDADRTITGVSRMWASPGVQHGPGL